jgi:hypothetical protein
MKRIGIRTSIVGMGMALFAAGCGAPPSMPPPGTQALTLGTADASGHWSALTDGQDVTLVEGAQGGFHVWMMYRLDGAEAMHVTVEKTAHRLSDGAMVLRASGTLDIPGGGEWESDKPTPMFMCPSPIGIRVIDVPITYEIKFLDESGHERAGGSIDLVPHCPDANRDFCERICVG